jgi:hypothetical protein
VSGDGQAVNGARSSEHWKVVPGSGGSVCVSSSHALTVNVADVSPVTSSGPVRISVSGLPSDCQRYSTGVGSTFSNMSIARIRRTWSVPTSSSNGR